MPKFQLESFPAERQAAQLMSQANSEHGHLAQQLPNIFDRVRSRLRIARPIRQEHAVRAQFHHIFCGSLCRHDNYFATVIDQQPQNILLNSEIVSRDPQLAAAF